MPLFSMISAIQILVPLGRISAYFTGLAEIRLMLDLFQDFMHKLFKSNVHPFCSANMVLSPDLPSGPLLKAFNSGFLFILKQSKGLPFIL